ncbi:MAG: hypothetical protein ACRC30_07290 [Clostridium sp.]
MRNIISFTEQVVRKGESPSPKMYKILSVGAGIIALDILLQVWIDGLSIKLIWNETLIIVLILRGLIKLRPSSKLIQARNSLGVDNENLIYEVVEMGNEIRKAIFPIKSITNIQFREKDRVLVIQGEPRVEAQNLKNNKVKVYDFHGKKKNVDMKVGDMEKEKLLRSLEENLGCIVEVV